MNEEQKLRVEILSACGYNIEAARKCWDFVRSGYEAKKQESACDRLADGIYLINEYEELVPFDGKEKIGMGLVTHIGIVQGNRSLAISLHDVSKNAVSLTTNVSKEYREDYKDEYMYAVEDWDGNFNTERLKQIGLAIELEDGEYIPALAELYLINLNQDAINAAMRFAGGQELKGWYWSSTEKNATQMWGLYLVNGNACIQDKATSTGRVRPVKKLL